MASFWTDNAYPGGGAPSGGGSLTTPYQPPPLPPAANADTTKAPWTNQPDFNLGGFQPAPISQAPGSDFGMKDPMKPLPAGLPSNGIGFSNQTGAMSTLGQFMSNAGPAMQSGVARQAPMGVGQQQTGMNQGAGYPSNTMQPMNPSQQNQTLMQSPTGQFQYVNNEHIPHYQGLGAQVYNGSSYGSSSGGY